MKYLLEVPQAAKTAAIVAAKSAKYKRAWLRMFIVV
jgi:hypothetical protein